MVATGLLLPASSLKAFAPDIPVPVSSPISLTWPSLSPPFRPQLKSSDSSDDFRSNCEPVILTPG